MARIVVAAAICGAEIRALAPDGAGVRLNDKLVRLFSAYAEVPFCRDLWDRIFGAHPYDAPRREESECREYMAVGWRPEPKPRKSRRKPFLEKFDRLQVQLPPWAGGAPITKAKTVVYWMHAIDGDGCDTEVAEVRKLSGRGCLAAALELFAKFLLDRGFDPESWFKPPTAPPGPPVKLVQRELSFEGEPEPTPKKSKKRAPVKPAPNPPPVTPPAEPTAPPTRDEGTPPTTGSAPAPNTSDPPPVTNTNFEVLAVEARRLAAKSPAWRPAVGKEILRRDLDALRKLLNGLRQIDRLRPPDRETG